MDHKTSAPVLSQRQLSRTAELFRGLARLTGEKPYGEITVAEIAREAGIHRATFYRHFETKDDLLQRGAEIFWDGMNRKISARRLEMGKLKGFHERIRSMMGFFFNEVEENREILTPLLGSSGPPVFRKITEQRLTSYIEEFRLGKILPPDRRESPPPSTDPAYSPPWNSSWRERREPGWRNSISDSEQRESED